jgi:hypothetical protein
MPVDSYLELFTTLFGWQFYNIGWDVLSETGIVFLPFLGILIDNFVEPYRGGYYGGRVATSLQRMEIDIFLAFFVVVLAGQPFNLTPFNANTLIYKPPGQRRGARPITGDGQQSRQYVRGNRFHRYPGYRQCAVMVVRGDFPVCRHRPRHRGRVSHDGRYACLRATGAAGDDHRPRLRQEVGNFYSQCFVPARSKYRLEQPESNDIQQILDDKGTNDPEWLGSHVYLDTPGYYDAMRPLRQVPGWPHDPNRDKQYDPDKPPPKWGHPTCKQWWEAGSFGIPGGTNKGLREKLVDAADNTGGGIKASLARLVRNNLNKVGLGLLTPDGQLDLLAKTVLRNSPPVWSNNDFSNNNQALKGMGGKVEYFVKNIIASAGIACYAALFSVTMAVIKQALPIVQAVVLFAIYALLPFYVIASRYSLGMLFTGAMLIFSVKFWSVLWYLTLWFDQNLITSMYPDGLSFLNGENDKKLLILNMIIASLYLGLPLLWTGLMALAGVQIGSAINNVASDLHRPNKQAGEAGGNLAKRIGTGGRL